MSCRSGESASRRPWAGLLATLLAEAVAVVTLHRLGSLPWLSLDWRDPLGWLASAPIEDALAAVLRLVALGCAWWLLASTLLYLAARMASAHRTVRAVGWMTVPALRHVVDRALAVALAGGVIAGGGAAWAVDSGSGRGDGGCAPAAGLASVPDSGTGPPVVVVCDRSGLLLPPGVVPPGVAPPGVAAPGVAPPGVVPPATTAAPSRRPPPGPPPPAPAPASFHVVVRGDTLWDIAAGVVARSRGRSPTTLADHEIAPYWSELIDANRERLRSGDPDLVFPGENLALPPLGGRR